MFQTCIEVVQQGTYRAVGSVVTEDGSPGDLVLLCGSHVRDARRSHGGNIDGGGGGDIDRSGVLGSGRADERRDGRDSEGVSHLEV